MSAASKPTLPDLTASEATGLVRRRKVSSLELVEALLARIERISRNHPASSEAKPTAEPAAMGKKATSKARRTFGSRP